MIPEGLAHVLAAYIYLYFRTRKKEHLERPMVNSLWERIVCGTLRSQTQYHVYMCICSGLKLLHSKLLLSKQG